jgi:hypothetical protein
MEHLLTRSARVRGTRRLRRPDELRLMEDGPQRPERRGERALRRPRVLGSRRRILLKKERRRRRENGSRTTSRRTANDTPQAERTQTAGERLAKIASSFLYVERGTPVYDLLAELKEP